ncbi:General secretion pathway protein F [Candidatus Rhodobacter oscarellae]|uniref:General secretion pathway protein F n=1 Tax=Candidatus Rhodobacter oscarellae TaxID=1675527 RepID=A0A0J9H115_9RHOB|nr:type II secretion system F family protein [Candidatus Rhodobacter lobularis]KMW59433.1 General secretion pathway protein F [Candidatus Rhodobacter lobularis]
MQSYAYIAYDGNGRRKTGTLVAESERAASDALQADGLMPAEITARAKRRAGGRAKLDADERAIFSRQMAVLLEAELPVENALDAVMESEGSRAMQAFAGELKAATLEGYPLSDAIARGRGGFAPYYTSSLRAGESSGDLAVVFGGLADFLEAQGANRAEIATALIYPAFVALVSLVVCAVLVTSVAPEVVAMFEVSARPLPELTQVVLGATGWIQANWVGLAAALGAAILGGYLALRVPRVRNRADRILLRLPIFGRLRRMAMAGQYLRTLALVLGSRQTAVNAAEGAADVLTVAHHREEADGVVTAVRQGESLSGAIRRLTLLPPVALQLIRVGEESARLAPMADRAAVLVETWLANDRKRIAQILDPVLMMLVGVFVLIIVLAILLPIFELQSVVIS